MRCSSAAASGMRNQPLSRGFGVAMVKSSAIRAGWVDSTTTRSPSSSASVTSWVTKTMRHGCSW